MKRGFEFMDKELSELFPELEKQGGTRFVDMLVKTFLKDGTEEWILIHVEIQGGSTKGFAHCMFRYWYRIYDRYDVDITALAVFTGGKNFDKEIELLTEKENAMGIMETIKMITREEAREVGLKEGRKEGLVSAAENLLKRGMSVQEVSELLPCL